MQTNFFNHIAGLEFQGNLNLIIAKATDGKLTVSVLLANATTDKAGNVIPPMILRGEATELDEGFFTAIGSPLKQTAQLFANMDAYQKSLDEAQKQSKAELDKKNKGKDKCKPATTATDDEEADDEPETENLFSTQQAEQKAVAEKKKRYDEAMQQITELNRNCKYEEAIALMPAIADYPDKADEITRKGEELAKRKAKYDELMKDL